MKRLIGLILLFVLFLVFIVANLENRSDVSVVVHTFKEVPVYLVVFVSIVFGMLLAFFITLYGNNKKNAPPPENLEKSFTRRRARTKDKAKGQDGAYGID